MSNELRQVERAAQRAERARAELETAVRAAKQAGHPLRPIASAAQRSVEWTRRIVQTS